MKELLFVGIGGAIGSVSRYQLSGLALYHTSDWRFPLPTFLVNVIGCALAGVIWGLAEKWNFFSPTTRIFLLTGMMGGFTTFSAFGLETVHLLRRGEMAVAAVYVLLSVICGVVAAFAAVNFVPSQPIPPG